MRRSQFTDQEILHLLMEAEAGVSVAEICRTSHVSVRTFYRWRQRFGGLTLQAVQQLKHLEAENRRLRALVGSLTARLHGADKAAAGKSLSRPAPLRSEFGSAGGPRIVAPLPREGVALGRFAGVRVAR